MLAAQVNARKHENLRMILGFEWFGGLFFCEGLLCWVVVAAAAAGRGFVLIWTAYPSPSLCVLAGAVGPHCLMFGSLVGWMLAALQSCLVLMLDVCACLEGLSWPLL